MSREHRRRWAFNERFLIGAENPAGPMLERWRLVQTPWFGIYVHFIYREDLDRDPHDHPWNFFSIVLRGVYEEERTADIRRPHKVDLRRFTDSSWLNRMHFFPLRSAHRIIWVMPGTVTLCIVGRKRRDWGFWTSYGWVEYRDYFLLGGSDVRVS